MHFIFSTLLFLFLLFYCNFRVILEARISFANNKVLFYLILSCRLWFSCSWSLSTITRPITTPVAVFNRTPVQQSAVCDAAPAAQGPAEGVSHMTAFHMLFHIRHHNLTRGDMRHSCCPVSTQLTYFWGQIKSNMVMRTKWFTSQGLHHETSRWFLSCSHIQYWCDSKAKSMSHEVSVAVNHPAWHW